MNTRATSHDTTPHSALTWITGGGSGIGLACAKALGALGHRVAVSGRDAGKLDAAVALLTDAGVRALAVPLDVSDGDAVLRAAQTLTDAHGPVTTLIAAAGTNVPNRFWQDLRPADFAMVSAINLNGVASMVCAVLPGMRAQRAGNIIVISSWAGWRFTAFTGAAYGATKHGLAPLVESINEQEGVNGIRATVVCPGEVATPILRTRPVPPSEADIATMLKPEDVADAIAYTVSAPAHVCINELVISPTANRVYAGAPDLVRRR